MTDYHCHECKHSYEYRDFKFRCHHPRVTATDSWADRWPYGACCVFERSKRFGAECGQIGRLWEQRITFAVGK